MEHVEKYGLWDIYRESEGGFRTNFYIKSKYSKEFCQVCFSGRVMRHVSDYNAFITDKLDELKHFADGVEIDEIEVLLTKKMEQLDG